MKIERTPPSALELAHLYQDAGWIKNPSLERMQKTVEHQSEWFVARANDGSIMGIGRVITDYVRYAFIVDVIVVESHQGRGVGSKVMEAILGECRAIGIDSINLWPSKGKATFYERFGFHALPADQPHMKLSKP